MEFVFYYVKRNTDGSVTPYSFDDWAAETLNETELEKYRLAKTAFVDDLIEAKVAGEMTTETVVTPLEPPVTIRWPDGREETVTSVEATKTAGTKDIATTNPIWEEFWRRYISTPGVFNVVKKT